jgi:hypothetical protein
MPKIAATLFLTLSAAFVLWLCARLPGSVASHIDATGMPSCSMSRSVFGATMFGLAVLIPIALMLALPKLRDSSRPTVPTAGRWSVPASGSRHAITSGHAAAFAVSLSAFMDFVAWQVAVANQACGSPSLATAPLWAGIAFFSAFLAVWVAWAGLGKWRH